MKKVLYLAIDADLCAMNKACKDYINEKIGDRFEGKMSLLIALNDLGEDERHALYNVFYDGFIKNNPKLFDNILHVLLTGDYDEVEFGSYSTRGSVGADNTNAMTGRKNFSWFHALEILHRYFQEKIKELLKERKLKKEISCKLDKFFLIDLFNNQKEGEHFTQAMLCFNAKKLTDVELKLYEGLFKEELKFVDQSKFALTYLLAQRLAEKYDQAEVVLRIYDDKGDPNALSFTQRLNNNESGDFDDFALNDLHELFSQFPKLLPQIKSGSLTLSFVHYSGEEPKQIGSSILAQGDFDQDYRNRLTTFLECANFYRESSGLHDLKSRHFIGNLASELCQNGAKGLRHFLASSGYNEKILYAGIDADNCMLNDAYKAMIEKFCTDHKIQIRSWLSGFTGTLLEELADLPVDLRKKFAELSREAYLSKNQLLINQLFNAFKIGNYDKLVLVSWSNRNAARSDNELSLSYKTWSYFVLLEILHEHFQVKIKDGITAGELKKHVTCELDRFLMIDFLSNGKDGAHFTQVLNLFSELTQETIQEKTLTAYRDLLSLDDRAHSITDPSKFALTYVLAERLKEKYKNADITFAIYDDKGTPCQKGNLNTLIDSVLPFEENRLLNDLALLFYQYSNLLPSIEFGKLTLEFFQYAGGEPQAIGQPIVCSGLSDRNCFEVIEIIKALCLDILPTCVQSYFGSKERIVSTVNIAQMLCENNCAGLEKFLASLGEKIENQTNLAASSGFCFFYPNSEQSGYDDQNTTTPYPTN